MDKKRIISIVAMVVGIIVLIIGAVFLILRLNSGPAMADGEYLVSAGNWELDEGVIWQFTEIGKGTLTTNNHKNDYSFAWALEDGRMIVQTDWLYELDNEYDYTLDQGSGVLVLSDGEHEYRFVAQTE